MLVLQTGFRISLWLSKTETEICHFSGPPKDHHSLWMMKIPARARVADAAINYKQATDLNSFS